jgi:hypothetical protein
VHNAAVPAAQAAVPSLLQQAIAEMKKDQEKGLKEKSKDEDAWHKYHAQSKKELAAENIKEAQEKANETKEAKVTPCSTPLALNYHFSLRFYP